MYGPTKLVPQSKKMPYKKQKQIGTKTKNLQTPNYKLNYKLSISPLRIAASHPVNFPSPQNLYPQKVRVSTTAQIFDFNYFSTSQCLHSPA